MADTFVIRFAGHLDAKWSDWFDGLTMTHLTDGTTLLCGSLLDQSALYGLLSRLRDLGLPLLFVIKANPEDPAWIYLKQYHSALRQQEDKPCSN